MSQKLSVLVLSSWYPNRINPTDGNFNEKFAEAVAIYNRVDAIHVCTDESMKQPFEIVEFEKNGVKNHMLYFRKKKKENILDKILKAYRFLKFYRVMFSIYAKENGLPDIIHLNIVFPVGIIAFLFKKMYGIPYVISEHWTGYLPSNYIRKGFLNALIRRAIARNASALLPVTMDLKNAMINHGYMNRYVIVPNVANPEFFYPPSGLRNRSKKVILHVSTLKNEHKNITGILATIQKLSLLRQDFEMHIVGDGDARPHIERAKELGILDRFVFFFGEMKPMEIADKMRDSDFFVLFSNHENLPCVIVEAFACGLPVISTDVGGVAEHLNKDMGLIIEARDEEALLQSCIYMLDHCAEYNKENMHKYALENFSYRSVGAKITEIYFSVLS
jgi:glycosyltransferase involved in cell wall biosynthesis